MLTFISPRKLNFHHNNFIISNKGWHVVIKLASSLPSNGSRLKFWAVLNSTLCKNPKTYAVTLFRYPAIRVCNQYGAAGKWRVLHRRFRTEQLLARLLKDLLKVTDLHESYLSVSTDINTQMIIIYHSRRYDGFLDAISWIHLTKYVTPA